MEDLAGDRSWSEEDLVDDRSWSEEDLACGCSGVEDLACDWSGVEEGPGTDQLWSLSSSSAKAC